MSTRESQATETQSRKISLCFAEIHMHIRHSTNRNKTVEMTYSGGM